MACTQASPEVPDSSKNPKIPAATRDNHTTEKELARLQELQSKGQLSDRTVADYLNGQGANPFAADRMGLKVLVAFRRKMFALLLLQCTVVLFFAWGIANIPMVKDMEILYHMDNIIRDGIICVFFFVSSVVSLGVVAVLRYKHPFNIIALSVFTVFMSATLASLAGPNVHLGLLAVLVGFALVFLPCSFIIRNKVIEVFPVAFVAMVLINIGIVVWMCMYGTFMSWGYAVVLMVLNSISMVWGGYEIDRLCSRLKVDEYMLPVILLWAELLVMIFVIFSVETMCEAAGSFEGGCSMWAHTTWHCDCWIYDNGSYGKDKYRKQPAAGASEEGAAAPKQEAMQEPAVEV